MFAVGRPRPGPPTDWLVLPRLDGIGDFWLWLPFVAALKKGFPDKKIHLLANALWTDLAHATHLFDKITPLYPQKLLRSPRYRRATWKALQEAPSGLLLNTTLRRRLAVEDSVAWFYPAYQRITTPNTPDALEAKSVRKLIDEKLYQRYLTAPSQDQHQWIIYEHLCHQLGIPSPDYLVYAVQNSNHVSPESSHSEPYIVVLSGAAAPFRVPELKFFVCLLQKAHTETQFPLFILGGTNDRGYAQALRESLPAHQVRDLTGHISLRESISYIRAATGVIGAETGLTHIAATWGKPTLVLMGGGHWGRFFPYPAFFPHQPFTLNHPMPCYGCGWFCEHTLSRQKPFPCITALETASLTPIYNWLDAISAHTIR
jgi:ADP-heptose:LPS heptosyltransferase